MPVKLNLINMVFGRLSVVNEGEKRNNKTMWNCICICGKTISVQTNSLIIGDTKSCGCLLSERKSIFKVMVVKHGLSKSHKSEYNIWKAIRQRCYNPNCAAYKNYGGRGIEMCDRWLFSFKDFLEDVGTRPSKKHSIDRYPNKNGNYEPSNFRWATDDQQSINKRNNIYIEFEGRNQPLEYWSRELNVTPQCLKHRVFTLKQSFANVYEYFKNRQTHITEVLISYKGETKNVTQWAKSLGINKVTLYNRIKKGYPLDIALSKKKLPKGKQSLLVEKSMLGSKHVSCKLSEITENTGTGDMDSSVHLGFTIGKGDTFWWYITWTKSGHCHVYRHKDGQLIRKWLNGDRQITIHWK